MNDGYRSVLDSIASSSPTPGGGAVAALGIAHGVSLARMVSELTIGRERWVDGQEIAKSFIADSNDWIERSIELAQIDCEAFDSVMNAYRMPKENEDEIHRRKKAIKAANLAAATSPLEIARFGQQIMNRLPELASKCNANAITDIGSASHLIHAGVQCASLNVRINLGSLGESSTELASEIVEIVENVRLSHTSICSIVDDRI
tara:strand:- start:3074 stop:3685 length:612 start_codon:yes stop_codon:yes gene_type:complete